MKPNLKLTIILALLALPVFAARPLDTDDAGTVEKGKFETEVSFAYGQYRPDGVCHSPGFGLKHGLTDLFDLGLGFSHSTDKDADGNTIGWGMSPLEIVFKMALLKEHQTLPDISLSAGYEAGVTEYGLNLILSRGFGDLGLHYNLGYNSPGEAMVKGSIATSIAAEYTFMEEYRLCAELNGELLDDLTEVIGNSGLIGGSAMIGPAMFDLGLRIYDQRGPKHNVTAGLTFVF